ncbi:MAG: hypothetical protein RBT69_13440 [Spirochaetia bacterium]|jgi:archaellum component FlaC|nr:hypothetical protein [Spirochaetia bacterium]
MSQVKRLPEMVDDVIYYNTKTEITGTEIPGIKRHGMERDGMESNGRRYEKAEKNVIKYLSAAIDCLSRSKQAFQLQSKSLSEEDIEKLSLQIKHSSEIVREASLFHRSASALTEDIRKECADELTCAVFFRQAENLETQIEKLNMQYLDSINDLMEKIRNQMEKYRTRLSGITKMAEITRTGGDISFIQSPEMIDISV